MSKALNIIGTVASVAAIIPGPWSIPAAFVAFASMVASGKLGPSRSEFIRAREAEAERAAP
ncbi:MAG: hypothetical protein AB7J30_12575 [Hyphomicrobium sp.]|uniref:hypothetical protein n=1 Tax=Hyphomicrobium sp. TaxID=82 RepID=UPI003D0A476E